MPPKDFIIYIDNDGKTRAVIDEHNDRDDMTDKLHAEGNLCIGYVSAGSEADAVAYGNQVLR